MASEDPDSGDGAIIIIAEQADGGKGVFLQLLNTLEHSRDEIAAHEHFTQLVVILVLAQPNWPVIFVELLPEEWKGYRLFFVWVTTFELIQVECTATVDWLIRLLCHIAGCIKKMSE